ncbi:phosphotransferase [Shimia sp. SDUM112013]|uniref:phosphotransferase n=1 Tax=Shimia sp. SDUM112013 TaxID=3136160 RepID=UPI0032EAB9B2
MSRKQTLLNLKISPPEVLTQHVCGAFGIDEHAQWTTLHGGRTNVCWLVQSDKLSTSLVIKWYNANRPNPLFPNDPFAEARILTALEGQFPAQTILGSFETCAGRYNVFEHVPGRPWQKGTGAVAWLMRQLHAMAPLTWLRSLPNGSEQILRHAQTILDQCTQSEDLLRERPEIVVPPSYKIALLHSDIVPGNVIKSEAGLSLIDWQCPGAGDPCEDIAIFLSPAMQQIYRGKALSQRELEEFWSSYGSERLRERYMKLAPCYHWRMAAYCLWQCENGSLAYQRGYDLETSALHRSLRAYNK